MSKEAETWKPYSEDFDGKVFSFTAFEHHRQKIVECVKPGLVLNAGTGPTAHLNRDLIERGNRVIATDFSQAMLDQAKQQFSDHDLYYIKADSRALPIEGAQCDTVLAINSILPESPDDVLVMLKELYRVTKTGGKFIGVFPSFAWHERAFKEARIMQEIDSKGKRVRDTSGWQTCQTRESLESVLQDAGFTNIKIEEVFLNTQSEKLRLHALYRVDADEVGISEYFVTAMKPDR